MKDLSISIIIPAYNEETNIRLGVLDKVSRYLEGQKYLWEVLIVDDGSTDATAKLLDQYVHKNKGFAVIHNPHQGKAATVITGIFKAKSDLVLFSDLDQATPLEELGSMLPWFNQGYDIVIGSRNQNREGAPFLRLVMARGFMILRTVFLGLNGINDTQCGFKLFTRKVAINIFNKLKLYGERKKVSGSMVTAGFDIEVLYLAKVLGYKIKEVPVEWHYVETRRVNPIKDSWQGLLDIITIRLNAIKGMYK
jgi:dolichyl-phosphate beta-glucosyltransferase